MISARSEGSMPTYLPQILGIGTSVTHLLVVKKMRKWEAGLGQHKSALYFPSFFCKCFAALMVSHRDKCKHIHKSAQLFGFYTTPSFYLLTAAYRKTEHLLVNYSQVHAQSFRTFSLTPLSSHKLALSHAPAATSLTPLTPINIPSLQNVLNPKTYTSLLLNAPSQKVNTAHTAKFPKPKYKYSSHC